MTTKAMILGMACLGVVACAAEEKVPGPSETVGPATITSSTSEEGNRVESTLASTKHDDSLTVTFNKGDRTATLSPKWGQSKTVNLTADEVPADAAAANRFVRDAFSHGLEAGKSASAPKKASEGIGTRVYEPPTQECQTVCIDDCSGYTPCGQHICEFGCTVSCTP